jgi:hypothetical protein
MYIVTHHLNNNLYLSHDTVINSLQACSVKVTYFSGGSTAEYKNRKYFFYLTLYEEDYWVPTDLFPTFMARE